MKPGYQSTQSKIYGTIPRSEFYGFVLGYAVGTILRGIFNLQDTILQLALAAVGLLIGIWVDRKYFMVKDEQEEDTAETAETLPVEGEADKAGLTGADLSVQNNPPSGVDEQDQEETGSMQQRLKKMFEDNLEEKQE